MNLLLTTDACTLPTVERPLRVAEFAALFRDTVIDVEREGTRATVHLIGGPGLHDRVRDLTSEESSCCSFFSFDVSGTSREVTLRVAVPPTRTELLSALLDLAQRP